MKRLALPAAIILVALSLCLSILMLYEKESIEKQYNEIYARHTLFRRQVAYYLANHTTSPIIHNEIPSYSLHSKKNNLIVSLLNCDDRSRYDSVTITLYLGGGKLVSTNWRKDVSHINSNTDNTISYEVGLNRLNIKPGYYSAKATYKTNEIELVGNDSIRIRGFRFSRDELREAFKAYDQPKGLGWDLDSNLPEYYFWSNTIRIIP
jgi:hypothetical protein